MKYVISVSKKYKTEMNKIIQELKYEGHDVEYPDFSQSESKNFNYIEAFKDHFNKINRCDCLFVLDIDGYIGESVCAEIAYAQLIGKLIVYYSEICKRKDDKNEI